MLEDLRFALRNFRNHPGFTCAAVLTLALGIGANTAVFSVIDAILLYPIPFPEPDRLVAIYQKGKLSDKYSVSYPNLLDWQRLTQTFEGIAGWRTDGFTLIVGDRLEAVKGLAVSANFFSVLNAPPVLGRTFTKEEDQRGGRPVALLGEDFWKRRFAADPKIVGSTIELQGKDYDVIGVASATVRLSRDEDSFMNDVFVPIGQRDDALFFDRGAADGTIGLGRLKPGVTLAQARAEMESIMANLVKEYPNELGGADANLGTQINLVGYKEDVGGDLRSTLLALAAAVGFVLLIACTNVANLALASSAGRSREFGVRLALGAGRGRLVRQLLTESAVLSVAGGAFGVLVAAWATDAALKLLPSVLPPMSRIQMNWRVLCFALAASLVTAVFFGILPALKAANLSPQDALKQGGRGVVRTQDRAQRVLITAEVALTLALLIGAGLLIRSLQNVWRVDPGLDPEDLLTFYIGISESKANSPDRIRTAIGELADRLKRIPGVDAASTQVGGLPFMGNSTISFRTDADAPQGETMSAVFYAVSPDHFKTMRIPLLQGRAFTPQDNANSPIVTIIDEELARAAFPGQNPIGRHIRVGLFGNRNLIEIIGVARHVTHSGLDSDGSAKIRSEFYFPVAQLPDVVLPLAVKGIAGIVRSQVAAAVLMPAIRKEMASFDGASAVTGERRMTDAIAEKLARRRFSLFVLGAFAAAAVLLSTIGIYGVISYFVTQRTNEIGVRMALGAQPGDILAGVLGTAARLTAVGIGIGIAGALALTRLVRSLLFGVSAHDAVTFGFASALLLALAFVACYVPARRAMRVDPMEALRME